MDDTIIIPYFLKVGMVFFDFLLLCGKITGGSVAEWLKAHDSKSCMQKCIGGSNPLASARNERRELALLFCF